MVVTKMKIVLVRKTNNRDTCLFFEILRSALFEVDIR